MLDGQGIRHRILLVIAVLTVSFFGLDSQAGSKLKIEADGILIYSGPGFKYRSITEAKKGKYYPVSKKLAQGRGGSFYKVLISGRSKRKRVGYISDKEDVKIVYSDDDEDVDSYRSLALAEKSIQLGFTAYFKSLYFMQAGYQKYPLPNLYLKAYVGQALTQSNSNSMAGVEVGSDQLIYKNISIYTLLTGGVIVAPEKNSIFTGSSFLNFFINGGFGFRYHVDEFAAFGIGLMNVSAYSNNASQLSAGIGLNVEVGL